MLDCIVVLDFGSQYVQLITRRVREQHVFCEYFPWDASPEEVMKLNPKGFILSGGPNSIYEVGAPVIPEYVFTSGAPILGICYGMQAMASRLIGTVQSRPQREYGNAIIRVLADNPLVPSGDQVVWMSHGDQVSELPAGFSGLASSENCTYAAIGNLDSQYFGLQFHPEVNHTRNGKQIIANFLFNICGCLPVWTPTSIIDQIISKIRTQVGDAPVLSTISGGVDSCVATALVQRAVGDNLKAIFVDTGLMRLGERQQVESSFRPLLGDNLTIIDAENEFLTKLSGVIDPEEKRHIIGETFIRVFERAASTLSEQKFLVQGTIYPDVIESRTPEGSHSHRIKSHHNVGGLPENMSFNLVEPLRYMFKDEVREVGLALGLPPEIIWRQPFPGPGLAVRCLGEVTRDRLFILRQCDAIFTQELSLAGLLHWDSLSEDDSGSSQAFAALLPVKAVGVMGDQRTYQEVIVLRAVRTEDFMTADWSRLPYDLLARVSTRIVNEVAGVNRVVFDITSKPPATIEWE